MRSHIVFLSMHCPKKLYTLGVIAINLGSSTIKGKSKVLTVSNPSQALGYGI